MKLDRANRSFLALLSFALLFEAVVICGAMGDVLLPLLSGSRRGGGIALWSALAFTIPTGVGVALGIWRLACLTLASNRFAGRIQKLAGPAPDDLERAAERVGLAGRVAFVDTAESFSFVFGVLSPRVAVSRGLCLAVSADELCAVLEHERYHVRNFDPLKAILSRVVLTMLFFLPVLHSLGARYATARELAADRHAASRCGRGPLAGALLKIGGEPQLDEPEVTAAFGAQQLLEARVLQLETGLEPRVDGFGLGAAIMSLLSLALFTAAYLASVSALDSVAVHREARSRLAEAALRGSVSCGAVFAGGALVAYLLVGVRVRVAGPSG